MMILLALVLYIDKPSLDSCLKTIDAENQYLIMSLK